jgi:hypothetical protein
MKMRNVMLQRVRQSKQGAGAGAHSLMLLPSLARIGVEGTGNLLFRVSIHCLIYIYVCVFRPGNCWIRVRVTRLTITCMTHDPLC